MAKQNRGNDYYLKRLQKDQPALHASVKAGKISVNEARKRAGLGATRTRLHELKNAWDKATVVERAEFTRWAGLTGSSVPLLSALPSAATTGPAFDTDGRMRMWARTRMAEIMMKRALSKSDLADELGIPRLNVSVTMAANRGTRVRSSSVIAAVDAWFLKNASV